MNAIILCGGLGTRLGELTRDTPKPLLEVAGQPFVGHVLDHLQAGGVHQACLAVCFQWQKLREHLGDSWNGLPLTYSVESEPLGTGGAIRKAFAAMGWRESLIANGDTLVHAEPKLLQQLGWQQDADVVLGLKHIADTARYGRVNLTADSRVCSFSEKGLAGPGLINAGLFWVHAGVLSSCSKTVFSFEQHILVEQLQHLRIYGLPTEGYFIDMGIPEDLAKARADLRV